MGIVQTRGVLVVQFGDPDERFVTIVCDVPPLGVTCSDDALVLGEIYMGRFLPDVVWLAPLVVSTIRTCTFARSDFAGEDGSVLNVPVVPPPPQAARMHASAPAVARRATL